MFCLAVVSHYKQLSSKTKNTELICCHSLWDVYNKIPSCLESFAVLLLCALGTRDKLTRRKKCGVPFHYPTSEIIPCSPK